MSHPMVIIAPQRIVLGKTPSIYLAGLNGQNSQNSNWQEDAMRFLLKKDKHFFIMSQQSGFGTEDNFNAEQERFWVRDHTNHAKNYGVMLFWLAKSTSVNSTDAYAKKAILEFENLMTEQSHHGDKIVMGAEKGFEHETYVRQSLKKVLPKLFIHNEINETSEQAYKMLWNE